jgi:hypothetical protein
MIDVSRKLLTGEQMADGWTAEEDEEFVHVRCKGELTMTFASRAVRPDVVRRAIRKYDTGELAASK